MIPRRPWLVRTLSGAAAGVAAAATAAAAVAVVPSGAGAATDLGALSGFAGGTRIVGPDHTLISDTTALSTVYTDRGGVRRANSISGLAALGGVISTGEVTTSERTQAVTGGMKLVSHARTAGVNLLDGAIRADAVDTVTTVTHVGSSITSTSRTTFVGLHITGANLPVTIPQNYHVTIPGLANLVLNTVAGSTGADGSRSFDGMGLFLSLLRPVGKADQGLAVFLNPTRASVVPAAPSQGVNGYAYGSRVLATAPGSTSVRSGRTAQLTIGGHGTNGKTVAHKTVGITVAGVVSPAAITSSGRGTWSTAKSAVAMTAQVADVNLLAGLVTADALAATARATHAAGQKPRYSAAFTLVNVKVAGHAIPVDAPANTVLHLANLGTVTINKSKVVRSYETVTAIDIVLSTAAYGLPVGTHVELATAAASVT
jgi:flagellar basal body rod protein FlgF